MTPLQQCRRLSAVMEYGRNAIRRCSPRPGAFDQWWLSAAVVWGVAAFCIMLIASRKWLIL